DALALLFNDRADVLLDLLRLDLKLLGFRIRLRQRYRFGLHRLRLLVLGLTGDRRLLLIAGRRLIGSTPLAVQAGCSVFRQSALPLFRGRLSFHWRRLLARIRLCTTWKLRRAV